MGASAIQLYKLDLIQQAADRMCQVTFSSLSSCQKASAIGLLCKLLDSQCRGLLQNFVLISVTHVYHLQHVTDDPLSLQELKRVNLLDLFIRSFLRAIPSIWASLPLTLQERGVVKGWTAVYCILQRHFFIV